MLAKSKPSLHMKVLSYFSTNFNRTSISLGLCLGKQYEAINRGASLYIMLIWKHLRSIIQNTT